MACCVATADVVRTHFRLKGDYIMEVAKQWQAQAEGTKDALQAQVRGCSGRSPRLSSGCAPAEVPSTWPLRFTRMPRPSAGTQIDALGAELAKLRGPEPKASPSAAVPTALSDVASIPTPPLTRHSSG